MRSVKMGGTISLIGVLSGPEAPLNLTPVLMQDIRLQGVIVGPRDSFDDMNRAIAQHDLKPVVDKVFPMVDIHAAVEYMAAGKHFGKVSVRVA
jgi:NADPH:quinone reductase-like Zn-dependent oxidoreductase